MGIALLNLQEHKTGQRLENCYAFYFNNLNVLDNVPHKCEAAKKDSINSSRWGHGSCGSTINILLLV